MIRAKANIQIFRLIFVYHYSDTKIFIGCLE